MRSQASAIARMTESIKALPLQASSEIILAAADLCLMVDAEMIVQEVFLGTTFQDEACESWEGADLRGLVGTEGQLKLEFLWQPDTGNTIGWRHLNFRADHTGQHLPLLVKRVDAGEGRSVLIGRDLRPAVTMQQQFNAVMMEMEQSYGTMLDDPFADSPSPSVHGNGHTNGQENSNGSAPVLQMAQSNALVKHAFSELGKQPVAQIVSQTARVLEDMCIREAYVQSAYDLQQTAQVLGMDADELAQRLVFVPRKA